MKKLLSLIFVLTFFVISFNIANEQENIKKTPMQNVSPLKKKVRFIINPKSGTKKKRRVLDLIDIYLDKNKFDYEIKYTTAPNHATTLAKEAANQNYDLVIAIGGDGTVNEASKGLINSPCALGIIPMGSGNGFARNLKIPMNTKKAIIALNNSYTKSIDIVSINDTYFLGIAGIGFDAHIAHKFAKARKRGFLSYAKIVLNELNNFKEKPFEMVIDEKKVIKKGFLISFAKSSQYGNNIKIAPSAKIDDGYIYLTILKKPPFYKFLNLFFRLTNNSIDKSKYLETIKCKNIKIANEKIITHIDGEPILFENGINLKILPNSLKVLINKL
ncbi:MAG: Diacylglycerol kinase [Candidatus Anoxychlamydiales bacterium]|nr:Diacylglycerol kinase [Candidatus Anoxychlamydiales bacterium]